MVRLIEGMPYALQGIIAGAAVEERDAGGHPVAASAAGVRGTFALTRSGVAGGGERAR